VARLICGVEYSLCCYAVFWFSPSLFVQCLFVSCLFSSMFGLFCKRAFLLKGSFTKQSSPSRHTAAHFCNTLQYTSTSTLQHTVAHCNTLQHSATHCNTLQHTAAPSFKKRALPIDGSFTKETLYFKHVAPHCSTLQHTVAHCNTIQHIATHCSNTLQNGHSQKLLTNPGLKRQKTVCCRVLRCRSFCALSLWCASFCLISLFV